MINSTSSSRWSSTLLACTLLANPALAQTAPAEPSDKPVASAPTAAVPAAEPAKPVGPAARAQREISDRQLAGHTFQPSHLMLDPFLVTSAGAHTAFVGGQALGPALDWSTSPPTITQDSKWYGYNGFAQQFDFDIRFLEHYSIRLVAGGGMYTGAGAGSGAMLVVGTSVKGAADLELKGSWAPVESVRVAGTLGASVGPNVSILVLQGLLDAIRAGTIDPAMLADQTTTTTYRGGATAAWSPTRSLGFQGQIEYLYAVTTGAVAINQAGLHSALMAEFDFLPLLSWFPISVNGTVSLTTPIGSQGVRRSSDFGLGIWYSARKEVALGLESIWQEGRLDSELKTKNDTTWLNLRYYW